MSLLLDKGDIEKGAAMSPKMRTSRTKELLEEMRKQSSSSENIALGAGVGAALGGLAFLARNPMFRKHVLHSVSSALKRSSPVVKEMRGKIPESAIKDAKEVARVLKEKGIDPSTARIAVAGTGGTGKTTFSRALGKELGMKNFHLDGYYKNGRDLPQFLKNTGGLPRGSVAEQTHLLSQVEPDTFDAIIRLSKPMNKVKSQLSSRNRGAYQWELYDYPKVHEAIRASFNNTKGAATKVREGIELKVKPKGGFEANGILDASLRATGIDPKGLSRQQKVISVVTGKKEILDGTLPYFKGKTVAELAALPAVFGTAGAIAPEVLDDALTKEALTLRKTPTMTEEQFQALREQMQQTAERLNIKEPSQAAYVPKGGVLPKVFREAELEMYKNRLGPKEQKRLEKMIDEQEHILASLRNPEVAAHELGHGKVHNTPYLGKFISAARPLGGIAGNISAMAGSFIPNRPLRYGLSIGGPIVGDLPTLLDEGLATRHALGAMEETQRYTPEQLKAMKQNLRDAYMTYLKSTATTAGLGGLSALLMEGTYR